MVAVPSPGEEQFPWSLGVFDAHCHPTDTMSSVPDISNMKAKALVVMATRSQDQQLVAQVAADIGLKAAAQLDAAEWRGIVPSFGWHPWFSHHLYDDRGEEADADQKRMTMEKKVIHYQRVLTPTPEGRAFISSLPDPQPLSQFLVQTEARLQCHPLALVGEIGLDKSFRLPQAWRTVDLGERDDTLTPGGRESRALSPYNVVIDHQRTVLLAHLRLAGHMHRAVSMHGVQAHGYLCETLLGLWKDYRLPSKSELKRRNQRKVDEYAMEIEAQEHPSEQTKFDFPPRLCLHSWSGDLATAKRYLDPTIPTKVFFSFSTAINFSSRSAHKVGQTEDVIRALPADRILVESDLHIAGEQMDANLEAIARRICRLKAWSLEYGVHLLGQNWRSFVFGEE